MADHSPSNSLFGLVDKSLCFVDDEAAAVWQSPDKAVLDWYGTSSAASSNQTGYLTCSGDPTLGKDQQQKPQQLPISPGVDSLAWTNFGLESVRTDHSPQNSNSTLLAGKGHFQDTASPQTHALQENLGIATPPRLQQNSPKSSSSPNSVTSGAKIELPSLSGPVAMPLNASRKRKHPNDFEKGDERNQVNKKTTHNMAEQRYRANLNRKMAALMDCVPSLRVMSKSTRGEDVTQEDLNKLESLTPALNLHKATVFSKATEYIQQLEKQVNHLLDENCAMQARIATLEKFLMAGAMSEPPALSERFILQSSVIRNYESAGFLISASKDRGTLPVI